MMCTFVEAALLHLCIISLTFVATIDSLFSNSQVIVIGIALHPTDRITFIMRINILALAAIVQLSSLPFASANHCWKDLADYHCGAGYQEDGYFNIQHTSDYSNCKCCCEREDGSGYHRNTCDKGNIKSLDKGCGSCMGAEACKDVSNSKIGDKSCVNDVSCRDMSDSFIKEYSCRAENACRRMKRTHVGTHSCGIGKDNTDACYGVWDSTIGDNSCQKLHSCNADDGYDPCAEIWNIRRLSEYHDHFGTNLEIGNNACNLEYVCLQCENYSVVPDGACNGNKPDTYINTDGDAACNYCHVSIHTYLLLVLTSPSSFSYTLTTLFSSQLSNIHNIQSAYHSTTASAQYTATSTSGGRRLNDEDLNDACKDLANKLLNYTDVSIQDYPAFRNFVSESITDTCNNGGTFFNRFDFITDSEKGTCTIKIDRLSNMRLKNGDEISAMDYIRLKVDEYDLEPIEGFTRDYLNATDLVIEKYCDNGGSKSSKSSIATNGAKSGKDGKSSQAVLKKRKRMREPKSKKD